MIRLVAVAMAALLVGAGATAWLTSSAGQDVPLATAAEFLARLHASQFASAFALTLPGPLIGTSASELERLSGRQLCSKVEHPVHTHPAQTNGNRLRRWLMRAEIEMPEVSVEFEADACLLGVGLRRLQNGDWRVYRMASHAG